MFSAESGSVINGNDTVISDIDYLLRLDGHHNIVFENFHFKDCKYGFTGYGYSSNITWRNCTFESDNPASSFINGRGYIHNSKMIDCVILGANHALITDDSFGWKVTGNRCENTLDSAIYFRGWGHTATGNTVINAGKDCIKVLEADFGGSGYTIISGNHCYGYGAKVANSGGAINIGARNVIANGNLVKIWDGVPDSMRCIESQAEGSVITGNVLEIPEGDKFGFVRAKCGGQIANNAESIRGFG